MGIAMNNNGRFTRYIAQTDRLENRARRVQYSSSTSSSEKDKKDVSNKALKEQTNCLWAVGSGQWEVDIL